MLLCPSVFTAFHSKAFQDRPPPCFSCSLSPQFHWVDPLTELSHTELALKTHWHKITELICSSPGQKGVSHLTVPFLLPLNLAYADPSASAHVTPWQITSALEDWSFTRIWSWLCLLGRSSVSLPPSLPLLILSFDIFNTLILNPVDLLPAVHYLFNVALYFE